MADLTSPARLNRAGITARPLRADWHPAFDRAHRRGVQALLVALLCWSVVAPASFAGTAGGALLLVGGALIGMPHGSSDFVVAHRLLGPRLRGWWLPVFLAAYLLVTTAVLLGWRFAPLATFLAFLTVSGFHFGAGEHDPAFRGDEAMRYLARAATPIVPIFLLHPVEVAGLIGLMIGWRPADVVSVLDQMRPGGLTLYVVLLGWVAVGAALATRRDGPSARWHEAVELVLLAAAAALLPPLLVFTIYFCLLHAVRHMAQLGRDICPGDGRAALGLAAAVVGPSALLCGLVLGFAWDALAGAMPTDHLLAAALQTTASLTVPHVLLECWATRHAAQGQPASRSRKGWRRRASSEVPSSSGARS